MQPLSDRQQQILEILQTRQRISTEEIKAHFDISPATASRDIHSLVLAGLAVKASLGVKLAPPRNSHPRIKSARIVTGCSKSGLFLLSKCRTAATEAHVAATAV